jgi:activator of 2-hydroxyglutaryl-CoA dehydratase
MITAGIDVGSITAKVAILKDGKLLGESLMLTGYNAEKAGKNVFEEIMSDLKLDSGSITRQGDYRNYMPCGRCSFHKSGCTIDH